MLLHIKECKDHPAEAPCYIRGVIILTEDGPQFAYHDGLQMIGPEMTCGQDGCEHKLEIRVLKDADVDLPRCAGCGEYIFKREGKCANVNWTPMGSYHTRCKPE